MIKTKIDIPIYFGYLIIIFTEDVNIVGKKFDLGLQDNKVYPAFVQATRDKNSVSQYFIVFDIKHICHTVVAHEVSHCANWIFHHRGITLDSVNDEPYAYLVGWITGEVYKYADKNKITIKI